MMDLIWWSWIVDTRRRLRRQNRVKIVDLNIVFLSVVNGYILHHQNYSYLNMDGVVDIVRVDGCI